MLVSAAIDSCQTPHIMLPDTCVLNAHGASPTCICRLLMVLQRGPVVEVSFRGSVSADSKLDVHSAAPPILFQTRSHPAQACPSKFGKLIVENQHSQMLKSQVRTSRGPGSGYHRDYSDHRPMPWPTLLVLTNLPCMTCPTRIAPYTCSDRSWHVRKALRNS